jgi:hypothetical protein
MGWVLGSVGVVLSGAYLVLIGYLIHPRWAEFKTMPMNNLGDFLGGAAGPLAFFWLVLGFVQQGIELRQNSRALRLQAEELKNSVEQQKGMVDIATKELNLQMKRLEDEREEAELRSTPRFMFTTQEVGTIGNGERSWTVEIANAAADCSGLRFNLVDSPMRVALAQVHRLTRGEAVVQRFFGRASEGPAGVLQISYFDVRGRPWVGEWKMTVATEGADLEINYMGEFRD